MSCHPKQKPVPSDNVSQFEKEKVCCDSLQIQQSLYYASVKHHSKCRGGGRLPFESKGERSSSRLGMYIADFGLT